MSKQTAVEWLLDKLPHSIETQFATQIEQAKAMEKERMEDAFMESRLTHPMSGFKHELFDDYFNEIYGGDK